MFTRPSIAQAMGIAGMGIVAFQFGVYPRLVKMIGLVPFQRGAGVANVLLFAAVPNATYLDWNDTSLLVVLIILLCLVECTAAVVSNVGNISLVPLGFACDNQVESSLLPTVGRRRGVYCARSLH